MANLENIPPIFHPAQEGWRLPDHSQALSAIRANLGPRFACAPLADEQRSALIDEIAERIESSTIRLESLRQTYERTDFARMAQANQHRPQELEQYHQIVGKPELAPELVRLFGKLARTTLDSEPDKRHKKPEDRVYETIGGDIFGTMQYADWENTKPLDDAALAIPAGLLADNPKLRMTLYGPKPEHPLPGVVYSQRIPKNYLLMPQFWQEPNAQGRYFEYAILRRRRAAADIEGGIEIYKDTSALVVSSQMVPEIAAEMHRHYEQLGFSTPLVRNSPPAMLAGMRFEIASREPQGITTDILPIGAHYVLRMHRSNRSS